MIRAQLQARRGLVQACLLVIGRLCLACLLAGLIFVPSVLETLFYQPFSSQPFPLPSIEQYAHYSGIMDGNVANALMDQGGSLLTYTRSDPHFFFVIWYRSVPWWTLLVAAFFTLLMVARLLTDRRLPPGRARLWFGVLLPLMLVPISAFVLWQAPILPHVDLLALPRSSDGYATMLVSIYPCFFASLTSVFLWGEEPQLQKKRRGAVIFVLLCLPGVLVSLAFFQFLQTVYFAPDGMLGAFWPYLLLWRIPTLVGVSLFGGWLGSTLHFWLLSVPAERIPRQASPTKTSLLAMSWELFWRLGIAGLVGITITDLLFQMVPSFDNTNAELVLRLGGNHTLLPSVLQPLLYTYSASLYSLWFLIFLPFLLAPFSLLVERWRRSKGRLLRDVGSVLALLTLVVGVKDLVLALLSQLPGAQDLSEIMIVNQPSYIYCLSGFPSGCASTLLPLLLRCQMLCETTTLALMATLVLGNVSRSTGGWRQHLFWFLIGAASFVGSWLPLAARLNVIPWQIIPTYVLSDYFPSNPSDANWALALGLVLAVLAGWLGGWLRTLATERCLQTTESSHEEKRSPLLKRLHTNPYSKG